MKLKLAVLAAAAILAIAGCGGDDDGGSSDSGTEDSSSGASYDIAASEFVASSDKETILDFLADNPECEGAIDDPSGGVDQGFLLDISARATDLDPEAPIGDEILDACTPE
jgi:ABC-type glycerol-3-phosphate transport system substrate-binding protein